MSRFETRQSEWLSVMGGYPSTFASDSGVANAAFPIDRVQFNEATNYCLELTKRESAALRIPLSWVYRLPTEAEWEYACRAGTTNVFHYGNVLFNSPLSGTMANFDGRHPYPVSFDAVGINVNSPTNCGSYLPNAFGLYDMHGNVAEWCLDTYAAQVPLPYPGGSVTNPVVRLGLAAIARGGSYLQGGSTGDAGAVRCRSAYRIAGGFSQGTQRSQGFRVVLAPGWP